MWKEGQKWHFKAILRALNYIRIDIIKEKYMKNLELKSRFLLVNRKLKNKCKSAVKILSDAFQPHIFWNKLKK